MNVLGDSIDERGEIGEEERYSIHREAPSYEDQSNATELLETGVKVIDLMCPFAKGGKIGLFGGAGVGVYVSLKDTINGFKGMMSGEYDDIPEQAFLYCGAIEEVLEKAKNL
eukprot:snap_masked-scaffold962_size76347-processed-gene-0.11 protein:Tk08087 transcript:snap_masked-scaffold962_size76347-processed-gene-0.11-mRNA-1 annotation:"atp synthase beta chain"